MQTIVKLNLRTLTCMSSQKSHICPQRILPTAYHSVALSHDTLTPQVAAALNPLMKEKLTDKLQDEIDRLQAGLSKAHEEVWHHISSSCDHDLLRKVSYSAKRSMTTQSCPKPSSTISVLTENCCSSIYEIEMQVCSNQVCECTWYFLSLSYDAQLSENWWMSHTIWDK